MIDLGIDPGRFGAISAIDGKHFLEAHDCPLDANGQLDIDALGVLVSDIHTRYRDVGIRACIELIGTFGQEGRKSLSSFNQNFGVWLGALAAVGIQTHQANPRTWKASFGLSKDKHQSIALAKRVFPDAAKSIDEPRTIQLRSGRAEAALLAEYGRQHWERKELFNRGAKWQSPSFGKRKPA
jgi:hypothetical protein